MTEKLKAFQNACRVYFSSLGIGDLRNYGRKVGVSRPTDKRKEDLIEEIISVLSGTQKPIAVSKQGAPVKNDRVDERIPAYIEELKREFFTNDVMMELPAFDFKKEYEEMLKREQKIYVADPAAEKYGFTTKVEIRGQIHYANGEYRILPLDCAENGQEVSVSEEIVRLKDLRVGDKVACAAKKLPNGTVVLDTVITVNDLWTETPPQRAYFEDCAVCASKERIRVWDGKSHNAVALKFIEWLLPIAKGQRACIISAPKAGKTRLLLQLASAATALNKGLEVYTLLIDQAPEGVREFQALLNGEKLFYTTYEDDADRQVLMADFLLNRLKRRAESGKDVLLIVDSLTALARAYNDTEESAGGKTLSCGLEIKTMRYMKKYFGAARCLERGGSLTVVGAVSSDTGNPFDDVVCAEFAAQANYELRLSNEMAMRRLYPATDLRLARAKQGEGFYSEREEELDFLLRNEVLGKIDEEGILALLLQSSSYEDFIQKVEIM